MGPLFLDIRFKNAENIWVSQRSRTKKVKRIGLFITKKRLFKAILSKSRDKSRRNNLSLSPVIREGSARRIEK